MVKDEKMMKKKDKEVKGRKRVNREGKGVREG